MARLLRVLFVSACSLGAIGCQTMGDAEYDKLPAVEISGSESYKTVQIKTRPGVRQGFSLLSPAQPVAVALYFPGYDGTSGGSLMQDHLFRNNVAIAIIDPPSDRPRGFLSRERSGREHLADIDAVIGYLRQETRLPIWLVGISMGSVSVANVAVNGAAGVDGVVFMSSITVAPNGRAYFNENLVTGFALGKLRVPVLAVAHKLDGCAGTPASGAAEIVRRADNAPAREAKIFDGGFQVGADVCRGRTYHTFFGIESQVGDHIGGFIRQHARAIK